MPQQKRSQMGLAELLPKFVNHRCSQCRNPIPRGKVPKYEKSAIGQWMKLCASCYGAMTMPSPSEIREKERAKQLAKDEAEQKRNERAIAVQRRKIELIRARVDRERRRNAKKI